MREEYQRISSMTEKTSEDEERLRTVRGKLEGFFEVVGREGMELPPLDSVLWRKVKEYSELPENKNDQLNQLRRQKIGQKTLGLISIASLIV